MDGLPTVGLLGLLAVLALSRVLRLRIDRGKSAFLSAGILLLVPEILVPTLGTDDSVPQVNWIAIPAALGWAALLYGTWSAVVPRAEGSEDPSSPAKTFPGKPAWKGGILGDREELDRKE